MSEAQGPGELPPPAPRPKDFAVFWSDPDRMFTNFRNITGSNMNGSVLVLISHDIEFLVNMEEVVYVRITDHD